MLYAPAGSQGLTQQTVTLTLTCACRLHTDWDGVYNIHTHLKDLPWYVTIGNHDYGFDGECGPATLGAEPGTRGCKHKAQVIVQTSRVQTSDLIQGTQEEA